MVLIMSFTTISELNQVSYDLLEDETRTYTETVALMLNGDLEMLDNPTWFALQGDQARLGEGGLLARRFLPEVSPFAGLKSMAEAPLQALRELLEGGESAVLVTQETVPAIEGLRKTYLFDVLQMIDTNDAGGEIARDAVPLTPNDAAEMVSLAERTKPGPFRSRTCEMGDYIGLRRDGRLVAMAGERMKFGRFIEISAVCVDDEIRGQGIASRLINTLRGKIYRSGNIPFLHVRSNATATIRLYDKLGFAPRATFNLYQATADRTA